MIELSGGRTRLVFLAVFVLLLSPIAVSGLTYTPLSAESATNGGSVDPSVENVTFVSAQGRETGGGAGVYAIDTDTREVIWSHTEFPLKYFDVDPIGNDTVLFVAKTSDRKPWELNSTTEYNWKAFRMNWRTGEVYDSFSVPVETHDIDYLGNGSYIVANKVKSEGAEDEWIAEAKRNDWISENRANHSDLIYIYNRTADEIVWEYSFRNHFPPTAGDGIENDYTHLNDVDVVDNGSAVLASPREFDRVILINRTTKELEWTLGEEDSYSMLHEQHNPALLSTAPPTVLVADSENDRVVEYRKEGSEWERTWQYSGDLDWPRDADRLANGNTLIVDSGGNRVLEVTPTGGIVWEMAIDQNPYDVERLQYGDEPQGPPMHTVRDGFAASIQPESDEPSNVLVTAAREYYGLSDWVFPPWMTGVNFVLLHLSLLALLGWLRYEWADWRS